MSEAKAAKHLKPCPQQATDAPKTTQTGSWVPNSQVVSASLNISVDAVIDWKAITTKLHYSHSHHPRVKILPVQLQSLENMPHMGQVYTTRNLDLHIDQLGKNL